ncbi:neutral/alkaline non-lysosomal ceramidase N-terminal domain-containing protein [Planctomycetota bacterium]
MLVGTGRRAINPEVGHKLAGYGPDYPNEGIHDDVCVTALYMKDGSGIEALLLNFDLAGILRPLVRAVREKICAETGVDMSRIFCTCTHTHTGPEVRTMSYVGGPKDMAREDYNQKLPGIAAEAAVEAGNSAEECTLHYNYTQADYNMSRRYSFPDRRNLYIPQYKQLAGTSPDYVDCEIGIIAFRKANTSNQYKAIISNYTMHPVCVGNSTNLVSADYQGYVRRTVEETFAGCMCLATTGAAGDNHPLKPEAGFEYAREVGTGLGQTIISRVYDAVEVEYDTELRCAYAPVSLKARDKASAQQLPDPEKRGPLWLMTEGIEEIETDYYILGIGPIMLAGVPGELVSELGAQLKWSNPFLKAYVLYQATDNIQYIAARNQYRWGGYEADTACHAAGQGEFLVNTMLESARELLKENPLEIPPA